MSLTPPKVSSQNFFGISQTLRAKDNIVPDSAKTNPQVSLYSDAFPAVKKRRNIYGSISHLGRLAKNMGAVDDISLFFSL
jgi:hypothetical protein